MSELFSSSADPFRKSFLSRTSILSLIVSTSPLGNMISSLEAICSEYLSAAALSVVLTSIPLLSFRRELRLATPEVFAYQ